MRLIDADKLKKELKVNGLGYQYYMLDNAPTVKAVPVEWIKYGIASPIEVVRDDYYDYIYDSCIEEMGEISRWCIIIGLILFFISLCL